MISVMETMLETITNRLNVLVEKKIAIDLSLSTENSAGNKLSPNSKLAEKRIRIVFFQRLNSGLGHKISANR